MSDVLERPAMPIPATLAEATDPEWLTVALAPLGKGAKVATVQTAELIKTSASKVRLAVTFENDPDTIHRVCLKAFLDTDASMGGGATELREADFYTQVAPELTMRLPGIVNVVLDREAPRGILVMDDLIARGAHFMNALEPFDLELTYDTLDQIARLHAKPELRADWMPNRLQFVAFSDQYKVLFPEEKIHALMNDQRKGDLPESVLSAERLMKGIRALAERQKTMSMTLLHGDTHPGNIYILPEGPGFTDWQTINIGNWALDVSYHIAGVLPEALSAREERELLNHYIGCLKTHGGEVLDPEAAWTEYRVSPIYGYYQWAITRFVDPAIIAQAFRRLGAAVDRLGSYELLGV